MSATDEGPRLVPARVDPSGVPTSPMRAVNEPEKTAESADGELYRLLAAHGFAGPVYERFERKIVAYGYQVTFAFLMSGRIRRECFRRKILIPYRDPYEWSREDTEDLAQETVARASRVFRDRALLAVQWSPTGGASMATYFVGTCALTFAGDYRDWLRSKNRDRRVEEVLAGQEKIVSPDPADQVTAVLDMKNCLPTEEPTRYMLYLSLAGYSHAEIADLLGDGLTPRAVEGRPRRFRCNARRRRGGERP